MLLEFWSQKSDDYLCGARGRLYSATQLYSGLDCVLELMAKMVTITRVCREDLLGHIRCSFPEASCYYRDVPKSIHLCTNVPRYTKQWQQTLTPKEGA